MSPGVLAAFVLALISFAAPLPAFPAGNSPCIEKTRSGESFLERGDAPAAQAALEEAVRLCKDTPQESPHNALATLYLQTGQAAKAVSVLEPALSIQRDLALTYMNLSAAYQELKQPEQAVEAARKAIDAARKSSDKRIEAQANYTVGRVLFRRAADSRAGPAGAVEAEPYFLASRRIDPSIGANYFFLGVLAELAQKDFTGARAYYRQGCERHHLEACEYLKKLEAKDGATSAGTPDEKVLYDHIRKNYLRKGMPADRVDQLLESLQKEHSRLAPEARRAALRKLAEQ
jgi:tetratricopeptide (TPR) repeat protein